MPPNLVNIIYRLPRNQIFHFRIIKKINAFVEQPAVVLWIKLNDTKEQVENVISPQKH